MMAKDVRVGWRAKNRLPTVATIGAVKATLHRSCCLRAQHQFSRYRADHAAGLIRHQCGSEPAEAYQRDGQDQPALEGKTREKRLQVRDGDAEHRRVPRFERPDAVAKRLIHESRGNAIAAPISPS